MSLKIINLIQPTSILGGLFIGSEKAVYNISSLKEQKINSVITVQKNTFIGLDSSHGINHNVFQLEDNPKYELSQMLDNIVNLIHDQRIKTQNVHQFNLGYNLSPCVALAYLMKNENMTYQHGLIFLNGKTKCNIYEEFGNQLQSYYLQIIEIQRQKQDSKKESQNRFKNQRSLSSQAYQASKFHQEESGLRNQIKSLKFIKPKKQNENKQKEADDIYHSKYFVETKSKIKCVSNVNVKNEFKNQLNLQVQKDQSEKIKYQKDSLKMRRSLSAIHMSDSNLISENKSQSKQTSQQNLNYLQRLQSIADFTNEQHRQIQNIAQKLEAKEDLRNSLAFKFKNIVITHKIDNCIKTTLAQKKRGGIMKAYVKEINQEEERIKQIKLQKAQSDRQILMLSSNQKQDQPQKMVQISKSKTENLIKRASSQKIITSYDKARFSQPNVEQTMKTLKRFEIKNKHGAKKEVEIQNQMQILDNVMSELYNSVQDISNIQKKLQIKNLEIKQNKFKRISMQFLQ